MVRFIKAVDTTDKILDCIPIVSTVKNASILLYQLAHKVNKAAKPLNTSWKDDVKIHVLSKDDFIARISMIPIIGNLTALGYHLGNAIEKALEVRFEPTGYLGRAASVSSWGLKKHNYEVLALYLARNPDCSEKKLTKALELAVSKGKGDIVELILDSREDWSSDSIVKALTCTLRLEPPIDTKIAKIILEKEPAKLTGEQVINFINISDTYILKKGNENELIKLLIEKSNHVNINEIGSKLESVVKKKIVLFIFSSFLHIFRKLKNNIYQKL